MRLQLALNVRNLGTAVDFYSKMFGVAPAKLSLLCEMRARLVPARTTLRNPLRSRQVDSGQEH